MAHPLSAPISPTALALILVLALGGELACGDDAAPSSDGTSDVADPLDTLDAVDSGDPPDTETGQDIDDSHVPDDSGDPASDAADSAPPPLTAPSTSVTLTSGDAVTGELIATYDHNLWWTEPQARFTYALFDADRFGPWPDDRSLSIIPSQAIAQFAAPGPPPEISYRDFMRAHGFVIERPPLTGRARVITGNEGYHREENGYGDFAWDLVMTDDDGRSYTGDGSANADYLAWGAPVYLPTSGVLVDREDIYPDNPPDDFDTSRPNNLLGVHLGGQFYLYILHLQQGSIPITLKVGEPISAGTMIGRVGNSGVSTKPHVHLTLYWYDVSATPPRSWSVPAEWHDLWLAPSPIAPPTYREYAVPDGQQWISSDAD